VGLVLAILVFATAEPAIAQTPSSANEPLADSDWSMQVNIGPSFPLAPSPFSDHYGTGISGGLTGSVALTSRLRAEAAVRFQRTTPSEAAPLVEAPPETEVSGAEFSLAALGAGARYGVSLPGPIGAYLGLRAGGAWTQVASVQVGTGEQSTTFESASEISPWGEVGLGIQYRIGPRFSVLAEPRFTTAFTSERTTRAFSVEAGIQMSW
jgi:hypothetical protein